MTRLRPLPLRDDRDSGSWLSDDGLYRYRLWRRWDESKPDMGWIMLNPSTADAEVDDPTIRRCIGFARREGCGGIQVVNLYALRCTKPKHLLDHPEPEGEENRMAWAEALYEGTDPVVAAWGAFDHPAMPPSLALQGLALSTLCLGRTKHGHPRHPLYVHADTPLEAF